MSADVINLPPPPDRDPVPLPQAAAQAIRLLRHKVKELESGQRINRKQLIAWLSLAIKELELGLKHEVAEAGDLSRDLLAALGPEITGYGIKGARSILELILAALPDYSGMGGAA
jgi:hypothetical protein